LSFVGELFPNLGKINGSKHSSVPSIGKNRVKFFPYDKAQGWQALEKLISSS